jgi:hypothetical protein
MAKSTPPPTPAAPPVRTFPPETWPHRGLYDRAGDAIKALPSHFRSETFIAGVMATDLQTLNSVLGAAIEDRATITLNAMRRVWDPAEQYPLYSFVRQPQTFPDVLLRKGLDGEIILGIELKGWYLLSKEAEPSYRHVVTKDACAPADMLVLVPWALSSVLSGRPIVFDPYVEVAGYAAAARNHYWQHTRKTSLNRDIVVPSGIKPYPKKSDAIADKPAHDSGGNFGRLARCGVPEMEAYFKRMLALQLSGMPVEH